LLNSLYNLLLVFALLYQAPADFDSLSAKAAQARDGNQLDTAVQLYRQAVELRPQWAEGWWYLGTIAFDREQYAEAAISLSKVTALAPKDANAFAMLGLSEIKLDKNQDALGHLTKALDLGVGDEGNMRHVVLFNQATLFLSNGNFGRAQSILDQLAQQTGTNDDDFLLTLGRAVLGVPSPVEKRHDAMIAAGRAEVLAANHETQPALAAYADLVRHFPKLHNVEFAYGRFLLDNHMDDQAVAAFKREIENTPQHLLARLGIAGALLATDPSSGLPYAQQAAKLAPKLSESHYLLGATLLATKNPTLAIGELETARSLNPHDPRVYFELAKAYKLLHRDSDAAQARAKFAQLSPNQ
jgi:tetratricopeptide (TPR) repeat protein